MKIKTPFFILVLLFSQVTLAQQIIWNSLSGGTNSNGAVISYNLQNNQLSTIASLEGNFLRGLNYNLDIGLLSNDLLNTNGLTLGSDGMLYGVSYAGGTNGYGTLVEYELTSGNLTVLKNLDVSNGRALRSSPSLWDDSILSTNEPIGFNTLKIYPNPTSNIITIEHDDIETIKVFNLSGTLILTKHNTNNINVESLSEGIYLLSIKTKNGFFSSKFVKE